MMDETGKKPYEEAETVETSEEKAPEEQEVPETEEKETGEESTEPAEEAGNGDAESKGDTEEEEPIKDKYLRLMADFQNYKRRVEKERTDITAFANEKIIMDLLEVMDNFERALEHDDGDGYKEGMELIFQQLSDVLARAGVEEIIAMGEEFDPTLHNAVMMEETDEVESGKVSSVLQKGYTLHGKVIRAAMVYVAK